MKKPYFLFLISSLMLSFAACNNYDDFAISGTVVAHEQCSTLFDFGLVVQLDSPDSIGADYRLNDSTIFHNAVVCYRSGEMVHQGEHISGRIYWTPKFSQTDCSYHYRQYTGPVPEACFTELTIND